MPGMLLIEGRDKHGGLPWNATACGNAVVHLMDDLNLVDIYRQLHPRVNRLRIKESKPPDFFPVSRPISFDVKKKSGDAHIKSKKRDRKSGNLIIRY